MAFCSNCGAQLADGSAFCQSCGAHINGAAQQAAQPQAAPQPQPQPVYNYNPQPIRPVAPTTPAIAALKKIASSPLYLTAIIAYSLVMLFTFIDAMTIGSTIDSIINSLYELAYRFDIYELIDILDELSYVIDPGLISASSGAGALFGMIPTIIVAIGLWLIFAQGVNKTYGGFKTTGLTMIKVINIINLVFACIGYGVLAIVLIILPIALAANYAPPGIIILCVILLIVVAAAIVLNLLYYVKINKSLNAAKGVALSEKPSTYASRYVGVMCWISAVSGLFSIITAFGFAAKVSALCSCVAAACFGVLIFTYRSRMQALAYTPTPAAANIPTPEPAPVNTPPAE